MYKNAVQYRLTDRCVVIKKTFVKEMQITRRKRRCSTYH